MDVAEYEVVALLMSELIANSVEHAPSWPDDRVRLDVTLTDARIRVEVRDQGSGFAAAPRNAESPPDSHWGLHIVDSLADRWDVEANPGTLVWFEVVRGSAAGSIGTTDAR